MPTTTLQIPTPHGPADAVVAHPGDGRRHPGVLLYPDAFGLRPELAERARELAGRGYVVLVPNVYHRHGPAPVVELPAHIGEDVRPEIIGRLMPMVGALTADLVRRDADAYLRFLTSRSGGPVGVVGYCIGAAWALRAAAAHPGTVAAVAGFHPGFLVTDAPDSPHRHLSDLTAEVHLGLAGGDLSPEAVRELERALAGVEHTIETCPGTIHGFTMSDTDAFDPDARQRHRDRLLPLLDRNLTRQNGRP